MDKEKRNCLICNKYFTKDTEDFVTICYKCHQIHEDAEFNNKNNTSNK